jgi:hypothetical protein
VKPFFHGLATVFLSLFGEMSQHGYHVASTSTRKSEKTLLTLKAALSLHQKKNKKQK